jgi:hypothetical protein
MKLTKYRQYLERTAREIRGEQSEFWSYYEIRFWQDNEYAVYSKDVEALDYLFRGTLEEVNAWLSLKERGFNL